MLRNVRIGLRLFLGFGLLGVIVVMLGQFSLIKMNAIDDSTEEIVGNWLPALDAVAGLNLSYMRYRAFSVRLVLAQSSTELGNIESRLNELHPEIEKNMQAYKNLLAVDEERELFHKLVNAKEQYIAVVQ